MSGWFTTEQIDESTFALSEYGHWEETHSYLLLGNESAVLIDTGLGVADIRKAVESLTDLPVTVLTTHAHWDHIGGHWLFSHLAVHEAEEKWLSECFPLPLEAVKASLSKGCNFPEGFDLSAYRIFHGVPERTFRDGDRFDLGNRSLTVLHTPGHSPGHCCFYEEERKYLYSGDLIYAGCLDAFYPSTDPALFSRSVEKIAALPVSRVLPAHHRLSVPVSLIGSVREAFSELESRGQLCQGAGIFDFGEFQIHL